MADAAHKVSAHLSPKESSDSIGVERRQVESDLLKRLRILNKETLDAKASVEDAPLEAAGDAKNQDKIGEEENGLRGLFKSMKVNSPWYFNDVFFVT